MIKKCSFKVLIGLGISFFVSFFNLLNGRNFADTLFLIGMAFLLFGGFQFISDKGLFNFQKYAFHRVSKKLPDFSRLLLNGNARFGDYEDKLTGSEKKPAKDYFDYLDRYLDQSNLTYGYVNLITSISLIVLSMILSSIS